MKMTTRQIIEEIDKLEPTNVVDYILQGSGLSRFMEKYNIGEHISKRSVKSKKVKTHKKGSRWLYTTKKAHLSATQRNKVQKRRG